MEAESTKADEIALELEDDIVSGRIEAGSVLRQEQLSERYGVSRTPIREALRRLAAHGLVSFTPNRGVRVRTLSRDELREAFLVRAELESLATELAVPRMTPERLAELDAAEQRFSELTVALRKKARGGVEDSPLAVEWMHANYGFHDVIYAAAETPYLERLAKSARTDVRRPDHVGRAGRARRALRAERPRAPGDTGSDRRRQRRRSARAGAGARTALVGAARRDPRSRPWPRARPPLGLNGSLRDCPWTRQAPFGTLLGVRTALFVTTALSGLALLAGAASSAPVATCKPTPEDAFGPFGRVTPPQRAKIGTGHVLTGIVLSALDCKPIRGARVEFWQANKQGVYTRSTSGSVRTNAQGRFRFEGPYPASYEGRPAHIHIRVVAKFHELLLTRYEPRGARRGAVRIVLKPQQV